MGNCLKTKLKASVNNPDLKKFGEFTVTTKAAATSFISSFSDGSTVYSNVYSDDPNVTITEGSVLRVEISGQGTFQVKNKYLCTTIQFNSTGLSVDINDVLFCPLQKISSSTYGNSMGITSLSVMDKFTALSELYLVNYMISGGTKLAVSELLTSNLKASLRKLNFTGSNTFTGTLAQLAQLPNVTDYGKFSDSIISGAIEDMVAVRKNLGQTSGSFAFSVGNSQLINFKNTNAPIGDSTVTWEASGANTSITFNGQSTVITVNNDNTWTRVS